MKLSKLCGLLTAAVISASSLTVANIGDKSFYASAEEWCYAGETCEPLHDTSRDIQKEGVGNPLNFGERNTPADASTAEIRAINHKMTVQEVKYALYKEIDEHWDLISTRLGQTDREKMYALFLGLGSRESTLGEGKIGSDHETAYEDGWGVNSAHAYGTLQTAVTAFKDCDPKFMPEDNVPEMFQYSFTESNFYDCIISNHMGIRKILHFAEICIDEQDMHDYQVVRNSLKGFNTGWCTKAEDDGAYATYADEICAMAQFYYYEGHLYDNVFTWTSANGDKINKYRTADRWDWWGNGVPSMAPIEDKPVTTTTTTTSATTTTTTTAASTTTAVTSTTKVTGQSPVIICSKQDLKVGEKTSITVENASSASIKIAKSKAGEDLIVTDAFKITETGTNSVSIEALDCGVAVFDVIADDIEKRIMITSTDDSERYDVIRNARIEEYSRDKLKIEGMDAYSLNDDSFGFFYNGRAFEGQGETVLKTGNVVSGVIRHGTTKERMLSWAGLVLDEPAADKIIYGDANCDGAVDMSDVVLIMQSLANPNKFGLEGTDSKHLTEKGADNADVDTSSKGVTANDALRIQEYLLHKLTTLDPA
jgi:hypothetical protein